MYWEVGIKMDGVSGVYNVHPQPLPESSWNHAVEHALDMAQALYPQAHIEHEHRGHAAVPDTYSYGRVFV
jgi:hypothetical protein